MILKFLNEVKTITLINRKDDCPEPFNIVLAISDSYYKENLHSQVLGFLLGEKKYKTYFIEYLNKYYNTKIDIRNYINYAVTNEIDGRIDLLLKSEESKHCIIVENKINNATDMPRQIPRYVQHMISKGFEIDAIIYFSINGLKDIDKTSWSKDDCCLMDGREITYLAAVGGQEKTLINGFLKPGIKSDSRFDEMSYIAQYIDLLEYLGRSEMEKEKMNDFYNMMMIAENYSTAIGVRDMINDMCKYRRDRLFEYFLNNKTPFDRIGTYSNNTTLFFGIRKLTEELVKIDLNCFEKETVLCFWVQEPNIAEDFIGEVLTKIGEIDKYEKESDNLYKRSFKFPNEEKELYKYIEYLLSELNDYVEQKHRTIAST